jgi:hypothetical protein
MNATTSFRPVYTIICSLLLLVAGCSIFDSDVVVYSTPGPGSERYTPPDYGDYIVAVAISGGGSRSAVFAAAVMKELYRQVKLPDGRSIVDEIDVMSGVSGGSLASAYWCVKKPEKPSTDTEAYDAFCDSYCADMKKNIEAKVIIRPFQFYRNFLKPGEKGYLLRSALDDLFFSGVTFGRLARREEEHACPVLIMNGTILDTGGKFLFTNLPRAQFDLGRTIRSDYGDAGIVKSGLPIDDDITGTLTCDDIGLSITDMEISRGVTGSAGVPLLVGPVILMAQRVFENLAHAFLHIYDGGIADNVGVETLMEHLMVRTSDPIRHHRGAMVIIIDAGIALDPRHTASRYQDLSAGLIANRTLDIYIYREKYFIYRTIMFYQKQLKGMEHIDFVLVTPYLSGDEAIIKTFESTPTRFRIEEAQADALDRAAEIAVGKVRDRILGDFETGLPPVR